MSEYMKLQPYFKNTFTQYNNLQKNELIALTKCNIEEWKDKSSLDLISTMFSIDEKTFIEIMIEMGIKIKSAYVYSFVDTTVETFDETLVESSINTSIVETSVDTSEQQPNWICSTCTYSTSNAKNECEMCGFPKENESSILSSSLLNILNEPAIPITNITDNISDTASVTTSIGTNNSSTIDHTDAVKSKIYVKGWDIKDSPFPNNTQNDLLNHFNNAMCRAREGGLIKYIIGIEQLPKPNSVLLICINPITATAALELNNAVMWKDKYLEVKRPQGYHDEGISSIILKMNVIPEKKGITLPPIYSSADLKEMERIKMLKKRDKIENDKIKMANSYAAGGGGGVGGGGGSSSRPPLVPKKKTISVTPSPTLTPEQKTLVDSLKAKLRKAARECLNILCAHDGRETSVHSEALSELCHVLQDHGILTAVLKGNKLIIKDNISSSRSFCIDMNNHAQGHVMLHSIADVRNLLRTANFPEFAFA